MKPVQLRPFVAIAIVSVFGVAFASPALGQEVDTVQLPDNVYRPQLVVDEADTVHMVYADKEIRGDLYYMRQEPGQQGFSDPIKVNSTPNCSAAFNMAVGKNGRVHVVIRPNAVYSRDKLGRPPKFPDLKYMLYHRLNDEGTGFEEERDLSAETYAFEGVGAVVADDEGAVSVYWHGLEPKDGESVMRKETERNIYLAKSTDEGVTFTEPAAVQVEPVGACACCGMQGTLGEDGEIYLMYRNSFGGAGAKNSYLLTSEDGVNFSAQLLEEFPAAGCPGSVYAVTWSPSGVYAGWDTQGHVSFTKANSDMRIIKAQDGGKPSRTPALAVNQNGDVLFAWAQATNPQRFMQMADLAWQVYDKNGRPKTDRRNLVEGGVALWGMPAIVVKPSGDFVIYHDGPGVEQE